MLRFLLWRLLGLLVLLAGLALVEWFLHGGPGRLLRGSGAVHLTPYRLLTAPIEGVRASWAWAPRADIWPVRALLALLIAQLGCTAVARWQARRRRSYVRLRVESYRTDQAGAEAVVRMFDTVQFLDSPGARRAEEGFADHGDGGDAEDDRELAGVGAEQGEVSF